MQETNIITRVKQLSLHNSGGGLHLGLGCITLSAQSYTYEIGLTLQ